MNNHLIGKQTKRNLAIAVACCSAFFAGHAAAEPTRVDQMISPAFHQVNFEDPRNISEIRAIYAYHDVSKDFEAPVSFVNIWAAQVRASITDKLSVIATKDGWVRMSMKGSDNQSGFGDIGAGLKYTFFEDQQCGRVAAATLRYIAPTGEHEVFQGYGDGFIQPGVSGAFALDDEFTLTTSTDMRIAMDTSDSTMWDVDAMVDYRIDTSYGAWHPLLGISMIMVADAGDRVPLSSEGQDYFVFGSSNAQNATMVIGAAGLRFKPSQIVDIGGSLQFPMDTTQANAILDYRWTADVGVRF
jgi:hypothetical protein